MNWLDIIPITVPLTSLAIIGDSAIPIAIEAIIGLWPYVALIKSTSVGKDRRASITLVMVSSMFVPPIESCCDAYGHP
jgi:hypothetical protein